MTNTGAAKEEFYLSYDHPLDMRTGVPCPECHSEIVYNGNYYCSQFEGDSPQCTWAMSEEGPLFQRCYQGLMANRRKSEELEIARQDRCNPLTGQHSSPHRGCILRSTSK